MIIYCTKQCVACIGRNKLRNNAAASIGSIALGGHIYCLSVCVAMQHRAYPIIIIKRADSNIHLISFCRAFSEKDVCRVRIVVVHSDTW